MNKSELRLSRRPTKPHSLFPAPGIYRHWFRRCRCPASGVLRECAALPMRVFAAQPANQLDCFGRHAGTTATAMTGFPLPVEAESLAVPADDRLGFDYDQCRSP